MGSVSFRGARCVPDDRRLAIVPAHASQQALYHDIAAAYKYRADAMPLIVIRRRMAVHDLVAKTVDKTPGEEYNQITIVR